MKQKGAELVVNISASPFSIGKNFERKQLVSKKAKEAKVSMGYCNMVGGQDDLVFDGNSLVADEKGNIVNVPVSSISSDSDIVAGAYTTYRHNQFQVQNIFSGDYRSIDLFEFALDESQIDELYNMSFDVITLVDPQSSSSVEEFGDGTVITSSSTSGSIQEFGDGTVITSSSTTGSIQEFGASPESACRPDVSGSQDC